MSTYMGSTSISASKTAGEIQALLGSSEAVEAVQIEYDGGEAVAVGFIIEIRGQRVPFRLPIRIEALAQVMLRNYAPSNRGKAQYQRKAREQAGRTAWRQVLKWVQAQLALVDTGLVEMDEVFMPYVQVGVNETLYQRFLTGVEQGKYLTGPGGRHA